MKITTGINNFDIISSGTVIAYDDETINFDFAENLKYRLKFVTDLEDKSERMDFKILDETCMSILLINFAETLGGGNAEPLLLGHLDGRNIYLNFYVSIYGNDRRVLNYTWYRRESTGNE
ncbi:DUF6864 domain-containing function [Chryseobacterium sp. CFS15]|uniref:DUF6864 domain-containing function n=1 Tax=Chryseobacterium sp. CFS15 TaxID=2986946 RepID=UPI0028088D71|nr:hypothetical protein [Chryseobacterium sp. CFS15]MDQ8143410.1 hypothetical protein [Chryseobacterium sp. CFS15]